MMRRLLLVLLCSLFCQGCGTQKSEQRCRHDVLNEIWFPDFQFNDATLCDVVQFMADQGERMRDGGWSPRFVVESGRMRIDIKPTPRGEPLPNYDFDQIKNPRLSLYIKQRITLKRALDAVCEKSGFQWKAEETYVRIFKRLEK